MFATTLPSFESYGNYSSDNYGVNTLVFTDAQNRDFYFSYRTLVAVRAKGRLVVHTNDWSQATGKHLNWIDGGRKSERLNAEDFEQAVAELTGQDQEETEEEYHQRRYGVSSDTPIRF